MNSEQREKVDWQTFLTHPFSTRARNFFQNAEISDVDKLTTLTERELLRFRPVGLKTVMEIRLALNCFGLSLRGEGLSSGVWSKDALHMLVQEQSELETRLRDIKQRIKQLKAAKPRKPNLNQLVFARWLELRDFDLVANEFSLPRSKVLAYVNITYRSRIESGAINQLEIFDHWKTNKSYVLAAEKFDLPVRMVRNIVLRLAP